MSRNRKITLLIIILSGFILPFIHTLVFIEFFILPFPFAFIFVVSLIILIIGLIKENINNKTVIFLFILLPIFLISQVVSAFTVHAIQRFRSNLIIVKIEKIKVEKGVFPNNYKIMGGIEYLKDEKKEQYILKYSRGFMVTERYNSETKTWINIK